MAHGLAAQLGGALTITSEPGAGTTVEFWLPLSSDALVLDNAPAVPAFSGKGRGKVLLVDDETVVRESTADMLEEFGYQVAEAESGEAAMLLISRGVTPDLLGTDHLMPGMTGVELARTLQERFPQMPVLIVSGFADADGIAADIPRLTKPFRHAEPAASLAKLSLE